MDIDDIALWANGTWCFGDELSQYSFMSDDYEILKFHTTKWNDFIMENET